MTVEKYTKDGQTAILVSPGYGAGWSTWGKNELAYDKRIVEFWLKHKDDKEYLNKLDKAFEDNEVKKEVNKLFESWGYENVYFGGFKDIRIEWLPVGTQYRITEYDGYESIEINSASLWNVA